MLNIAGLDHGCRITAVKYAGYAMSRIRDAGYPWNRRLNMPDMVSMCRMKDAGNPCNRGIDVPDKGCAGYSIDVPDE